MAEIFYLSRFLRRPLHSDSTSPRTAGPRNRTVPPGRGLGTAAARERAVGVGGRGRCGPTNAAGPVRHSGPRSSQPARSCGRCSSPVRCGDRLVGPAGVGLPAHPSPRKWLKGGVGGTECGHADEPRSSSSQRRQGRQPTPLIWPRPRIAIACGTGQRGRSCATAAPAQRPRRRSHREADAATRLASSMVEPLIIAAHASRRPRAGARPAPAASLRRHRGSAPAAAAPASQLT
jgi:hypothetical protein